jgi:hypothetical protein
VKGFGSPFISVTVRFVETTVVRLERLSASSPPIRHLISRLLQSWMIDASARISGISNFHAPVRSMPSISERFFGIL